jgi:ADP-ribose pyrophosphatase
MTAEIDGDSTPGRVSREEIHSGRIVRLSLDTVRFPNGTTGDLELVMHPCASAVIPFVDPPLSDDPRVVLVHQYRYAAGGEIYEVPAGMPKSPTEEWESCARRELEEETGYAAGDLRYLSRILTTPGFTDETIHLFAATDLTPGKESRDRDEFMEVVTLPFSRVMRMIREGEIIDAKSLCALLFAASFLEEVWPEYRTPPAR